MGCSCETRLHERTTQYHRYFGNIPILFRTILQIDWSTKSVLWRYAQIIDCDANFTSLESITSSENSEGCQIFDGIPKYGTDVEAELEGVGTVGDVHDDDEYDVQHGDVFHRG